MSHNEADGHHPSGTVPTAICAIIQILCHLDFRGARSRLAAEELVQHVACLVFVHIIGGGTGTVTIGCMACDELESSTLACY